MSAVGRRRGLLVLLAAGALGAAATAGTLALWQVSVTTEGTITAGAYTFRAGTADAVLAPNDDDAVRIALPDDIRDELLRDGRAAGILTVRSDLPGARTFVDVSVLAADQDAYLLMDVRGVADAADCRVTTGDLPWSSGGVHRLETVEGTTYLCLEVAAPSRPDSATVTVSATTADGVVSDQASFSTPVHQTFAEDDVDIVLAPVIEDGHD